MSRSIVQFALAAFLFVTITGCASVPPTAPEQEFVDGEINSRTMRTIWTIGAILVVGTILVNEAEDGVQDSLRRVSLP